MSRDFVSPEEAITALQAAIDLLRADHTGQPVRVQVTIQRRDETISQIAELLRRHSDTYNPDAVAESIVARLSEPDERTS